MSYPGIIINSEVYKLIPLGECACGCGGKTTIPTKLYAKLNRIVGVPMKYIRGHSSRGNTNPHWQGGRFIDYGGYQKVYVPGHPRAKSSNHVHEHILLAEKALGKPLPPGAVVHHANGTKTGPLVICENENYHKLLHLRLKAYRACGHASWRKCRICHHWDAPENLHIAKKHVYHTNCANEYSRKRRLERAKR